MSQSTFPDAIRRLEPYSERFDAYRLRGQGCDVYFATYPAGTEIEPHHHDSDNYGLQRRKRPTMTLATYDNEDT